MSRMDLFNRALAAENITGVAADLAKSIFFQESSGGLNTKTSNAGAVGEMQIIPSTFKSVADKGWDIKNSEHNMRAGLRYVNQMLKMSDGDPALAAVGYYGGPSAIKKARLGEPVSDPRNPNAPDTFRYADEVLGRMPNNQGYSRLVRADMVPPPSAIPVMGAPPAADALPTDIPQSMPAYFGVPDKWSKFGRAMEKPEVTPDALSFGVNKPVVDAVKPGFFDKAMSVIPGANPLMEAFKGWGVR